MLKFFAFVSLLVFSNASYADSNDAVCRVLKKQILNSASYVEGVDAYGRPVTPAEGTAIYLTPEIPQRVKVPLSLDLAEKIPALAEQGIELNSDLGVIEIDDSGQVYRGDDEITQSAMAHCGLLVGDGLENNDLGLPQDLFGEPSITLENNSEALNPSIMVEEIENDNYDEIDDLLFGE